MIASAPGHDLAPRSARTRVGRRLSRALQRSTERFAWVAMLAVFVTVGAGVGASLAARPGAVLGGLLALLAFWPYLVVALAVRLAAFLRGEPAAVHH
ncbi:hypothetical protein [Nocardioides bruguierae]|uniref:Uncharacterized protein n=1 Tax=Nocardioides bruguierae TaxID=2945102 RepID=A0A9X2D7K5_9ACTN|nr:hypothetical protein [Nocardioides bruguierae]MCM0620641.1 hypothetical protein [Nocardioides bruguierae]